MGTPNIRPEPVPTALCLGPWSYEAMPTFCCFRPTKEDTPRQSPCSTCWHHLLYSPHWCLLPLNSVTGPWGQKSKLRARGNAVRPRVRPRVLGVRRSLQQQEESPLTHLSYFLGCALELPCFWHSPGPSGTPTDPHGGCRCFIHEFR